jgi:hypothetical protein
MKPLNLDNRPCSPVSSNCVIWQGPTIPCINICQGDSVSDVVAALATELCTLLDQTNVTNYDLTCLGVTSCGPQDFQALIQLLIDKICELNGLPVNELQSTSACPDCLVSVAPCFVENGQTTMQLIDYVQMIANKICDLIAQIADLQTQIDNLDIRVTVLENTPPPSFTLPSIVVDCTLSDGIIVGGNSYTIDLVLNALVNDDTYGYCSLLGATGLPAEIISAVTGACITSTTPTLSNPPTPFGTEYLGSWVNSPTTAADAITNIWLVLCDMYDYLQSPTLNVSDTPTVNLTYTSGTLSAAVVDTGWVNLNGFAYMSANPGRPQCRRIGNEIHFRGYIIVPMGNASSGYGGVIQAAPTFSSYISLEQGNTFNTITSGNAADSCELIGYSGNPWSSGPAIGLRFNRGNSVIPTAVLPAGQSLDGSYTLGTRHIIARNVQTSANDATLHSLVGISLLNTGALQISSILYDEDYTGSTGYEYSAIGRHLVSNIISGENIPTYTPTAPSIFNATAAGAYQGNTTGLSATWRFNQNAGRADQLGGFIIQLSGLSTFVDACDNYIPTLVVC